MPAQWRQAQFSRRSSTRSCARSSRVLPLSCPSSRGDRSGKGRAGRSRLGTGAASSRLAHLQDCHQVTVAQLARPLFQTAAPFLGVLQFFGDSFSLCAKCGLLCLQSRNACEEWLRCHCSRVQRTNGRRGIDAHEGGVAGGWARGRGSHGSRRRARGSKGAPAAAARGSGGKLIGAGKHGCG